MDFKEKQQEFEEKHTQRQKSCLELHRRGGNHRWNLGGGKGLAMVQKQSEFSEIDTFESVVEPPIPVTLDNSSWCGKKKKEDLKGFATKRAALGKLRRGQNESTNVAQDARSFTYFDPPTSTSIHSLLVGLLSPSDLLRNSAAAYYMANIQRYINQPQKVAEDCPGILKLNPYLAPAPQDFGYQMRVEDLDLSVEDTGDVLEAQVQTGRENRTVTCFGEFLKLSKNQDIFNQKQGQEVLSQNKKTVG